MGTSGLSLSNASTHHLGDTLSTFRRVIAKHNLYSRENTKLAGKLVIGIAHIVINSILSSNSVSKSALIHLEEFKAHSVSDNLTIEMGRRFAFELLTSVRSSQALEIKNMGHIAIKTFIEVWYRRALVNASQPWFAQKLGINPFAIVSFVNRLVISLEQSYR